MRRLAWAAAATALAAVALPWGLAAAERTRGEALYDGRMPLAARLNGHDLDLPPAATRCINCHEPADRSAGYAPPLDATLAAPRSRRGGPPTAYDAARLCAVLRDGVDPAHVIIDTAMPRYTVTDRQCRELWSWLSRR